MAAFNYVALDTNGKQTKGVLEGDSQRQVRQFLRDKGLVPLSVDAATKSSGTHKSLTFSFKLGQSISARDLALLTRQMATLVQAGLPIGDVLTAVAQQTEKPRIQSMMMAVRSKVLEGYTLANSLGEFPRAFPDLYRATVAAGEHSGHLDLVLNRLADYTETSKETKQKIQGAMVYPIFLVVFSVLIVTLLMIKVVPNVVEVFSGTGQELPGITQALISTSDFFVNWWWLVLCLIVVLVVAVKSLLQRPAMALAWHKKILSLPLFGKLACNINTSRFASTLSILTSSGVPLVEAMHIAGEVMANRWLQTRVREATQKVSEGTSLRNALQHAGYFPPMMLHMIASGESTGELDTMLSRVAASQEQDLQAFIAITISILPPLLLVMMAGVVLTIVLAILLPIIQMNNLVA
ncbi:MAG: type II secretion system protein GspF [Cellvibrionales bacterium]|jgi:general secretion pathway protein F|nr:type II secretion system inner membrane protein GspF [Cellvibrionales bacterium]TXH48934.1 MAG: type II secretion system protein GspF [Cellvibrionales bacterium]HRF87859.1 type II secretion system inner membrane protein GspF [Pseudomonadales bacterium]HRG49459.1 type II secretion system inner membrane protein GspF [Pseudomonadales bacterium]